MLRARPLVPGWGFRSAHQWHHPLARGGVSQAHRLSLHENHMSMVEKAVDQGGCDGLVHELLEANCCSHRFVFAIGALTSRFSLN